jgi:RHS repeat-associated protein
MILSQFLQRLLAALLICAMALPHHLAAGFLAFPQNEIRRLDSGGGVGGLLYTVDASDGANVAVANHRGDIVARYDESGANTYSATYESSGKVAFATGTKPDSHGQNSKEIDPGEVELAYFGYRYFDPEAGVWLSRDPAGFVDGMK